MPLPAGWTLVTVTGTYTTMDGTPATGHVLFHALHVVTVDGHTIVPSVISAELDADGSFAVQLPSTDDPEIAPSGWTWRVQERFPGGLFRPEYNIEVPHDSGQTDLADVTPVAAVDDVSPFARLGVPNVFTEEQTLASSFAGGRDEFDSTSRLNLESYQASPIFAFGEVLRVFARRKDAKQMLAWYFPDEGYDEDREPVGSFKPVVWIGAHWESGAQDGNHKHWSLETPDSNGALQTRLEVVFGDQSTDDGIDGLDKTRILTNLADFIVRCSNGQVLRLSADVSAEKAMEFANDVEGVVRQWKVRSTATQGDLQLVRYNDAGAFVDALITVKRSTGRVGIGTNDPTAPFHVGDDARISGDLDFPTDTTGPILTDRTTGTQYRLLVDNGALDIEAVP